MKRLALLLALIALAACETVATDATKPSVTPAITGDLTLGDSWRTQTQAQTLDAFAHTIAGRYGAGTLTERAIADLQHASFTCGENHDVGGRGSPPNEICRHTEVANGCTHTWQVHLFDTSGDGRITRARALFDKRCGREGLLGGPS